MWVNYDLHLLEMHESNLLFKSIILATVFRLISGQDDQQRWKDHDGSILK